MFLYVVTNLVNGKQYVGITQDLQRRWREHRTGHGSKILFQAFKKYGVENFEFTVICKGLEEYIEEMEIRAIRILNTKAPNGYNLTEGGGEGSTGWKASDETRKKMSKAHIGKVYGPHTKATKQKIRESRLKYKRGKHPGATKITVDAKQYDCLRDAAEDIGMPYSTFCTKQREMKSTTFIFQPRGVLTPLTL